MVKFDVDDLTAKLRAVRETGAEGRDIEIILTQRNLELGHAKNNLNKALDTYQTALQAAQQALYNLNDSNEPTLGAWIFDSKTKDAWVNKANPANPFGAPRFTRAAYYFFATEKAALAAYEDNKVDFILAPNGLSQRVRGARNNVTSSARFLVFNPDKPQFADPVFHAALSCMIDRKYLTGSALQNKAAPLAAFIVSPQWRSSTVYDPCSGMDKPRRIEYAVKILEDAGYSWKRKPTEKSTGKNLIAPSRKAFPKITLIAPSREADALRYAAAKYIAEQAQYLGIPFSVGEMKVNDVVYAVYSSKQYDAALVGWQLGEYPGYICEWFNGQNPYLYSGSKFKPGCNALAGESDLEAAKKTLHQIESDLMSGLPFIPLFVTTRMEAYQNLSYPEANLFNGWSGLYGAPSYAMPIP
jgi:ABC-type transport system substrate-binding protein